MFLTALRFVRTAALATAILLPAAAAAAPWKIDASHTRAGFKVKHMMVSWLNGEFGAVSGTVDFDPANLDKSSVDVSIDVASIDTREAKRDEHLRSPDFFDVATHPKITFKSKKVQKVDAKAATFEIVGDLTMRGITKEVVLAVQGPSPEFKNPWGGIVRGFSATLVINRQDWKVSWNKTLDAGGILVGDEVHIDLQVELNPSS